MSSLSLENWRETRIVGGTSPETATSLRVFLPAVQKRMIVREKRFDLIERYAARRIYRDVSELDDF